MRRGVAGVSGMGSDYTRRTGVASMGAGGGMQATGREVMAADVGRVVGCLRCREGEERKERTV